ncbi:hypothetical protein R3P38DRAFT_3290998 [Favolaschia claudopus]|uniref:Uncharacterized protein n=1 Tax=Favolaschia claudopus TaxID=2862362 RepID=A0AAV9ZQ45_9AGAR
MDCDGGGGGGSQRDRKDEKEQESLVKLTAITEQQKLFSQDMDIIRALMHKYPQVAAAKQESPFATLMAQSADTQSGNAASSASAFKFNDVPTSEASAPSNFILPSEFTWTMGSNNPISTNDAQTHMRLPKRGSWLFQNTAKATFAPTPRFETMPSEGGTGKE